MTVIKIQNGCQIQDGRRKTIKLCKIPNMDENVQYFV